MKLKIKFPIRNKLLLLMSAMVIFSIVTYLSLAIKLFKDDKTTLIYELNAGSVRTLSAEFKSELLNVISKVNLLTQGHQNTEWVNILLGASDELVAFALYDRPDGVTWNRSVFIDRSKSYFEAYPVQEDVFTVLERLKPLPFERVLEKETWVRNVTLPASAPIVQLARAVELEGGGGTKIAVATLRLDRMLEQVKRRGISTVYVVNGEGEIIAHPDSALVTNPASLQANSIVQAALASNLGLEMKEFRQDDQGYLAAYADVGIGGLKVISQVPEQQVFRAAMRLVNKSLLFGLLIVTIALLLSGRVARGLTEPLSKLVSATERIGQWKIDDSEKIEVKSSDEVGELARAFNTMASDLRQQREVIERHQAELEQKVRERTADLETQKKRVAEANEKLVKTTRLASLGELAGAAAHEVLNPMNNINIRLERMKKQVFDQELQDIDLMGKVVEGWKQAYQTGGWDGLRTALSQSTQDAGAASAGQAQALIDEDLGNLEGIVNDTKKRIRERESDFKFLEREIVRITKIVNNMRSLSRVGGERTRLDIGDAIGDAVAVLSDIGEKQGTVFRLERDPASLNARILADRDELVQVFSNLIRNAFHAIRSTGRSTGLVKVETKLGLNGRVEVRVSDNGTGIDEKHLQRIFEADFTTKSIQEGTGLGLSISRRIVRAFGGDLEVESTKLGSGTCFLAWFPEASAQRSEGGAAS